jgi:hypothetical protein
VTISRSPLLRKRIRPTCTSSDNDSMSAVIRDTRTPAFSRSKNAIESDWRCPNTRNRRSRRKRSPTRLMTTMRAR